MSAPVTSQIDWHGVAISVSYHPHQWSTVDHIEVNVIGDGIIPITETGYRPHYLHSDVTDEYGGAVAYVLAWLEQEAQTSCAARYMTVPSPTPTLRPGAANASLEPRIQNAARRTNDRFRKVGRELSSFASGKGTLRQSFVHTLPLRDRHPEVLGQPSSVYGKPSNA